MTLSVHPKGPERDRLNLKEKESYEPAQMCKFPTKFTFKSSVSYSQLFELKIVNHSRTRSDQLPKLSATGSKWRTNLILWLGEKLPWI